MPVDERLAAAVGLDDAAIAAGLAGQAKLAARWERLLNS